MVHFRTNIYAKCLALLVKHDPLCEESHHLEEFSRYVFTGVSHKILFGILTLARS